MITRHSRRLRHLRATQIKYSSLNLWFTAISNGTILDDVLAKAADGTAVRRWESLHNSILLEQSTSDSRPIYRSRSAGSFGGLEFDGTDDGLPFNPQGQNIMRAVSGGTLVITYKRSTASPPAFQSLFCTTFPPATTAWFLAFATNAGAYRFDGRRSFGDSYSLAPSGGAVLDDNDGKAQVIACRYTFSSALAEVYRNSRYIGNQTAYGSAGGTDNDATQYASVGYLSSSSSGYFKGHIHELTVWGVALSSEQLRLWQDRTRMIGAIGFKTA